MDEGRVLLPFLGVCPPSSARTLYLSSVCTITRKRDAIFSDVVLLFIAIASDRDSYPIVWPINTVTRAETNP
jgi:hypothetical protein